MTSDAAFLLDVHDSPVIPIGAINMPAHRSEDRICFRAAATTPGER
jgi:hypothetical protein